MLGVVGRGGESVSPAPIGLAGKRAEQSPDRGDGTGPQGERFGCRVIVREHAAQIGGATVFRENVPTVELEPARERSAVGKRLTGGVAGNGKHSGLPHGRTLGVAARIALVIPLERESGFDRDADPAGIARMDRDAGEALRFGDGAGGIRFRFRLDVGGGCFRGRGFRRFGDGDVDRDGIAEQDGFGRVARNENRRQRFRGRLDVGNRRFGGFGGFGFGRHLCGSVVKAGRHRAAGKNVVSGGLWRKQGACNRLQEKS